MEVQNRHIIGKQVVQLQLSGVAHAFELQQQVSRLFWETVAPDLEALFDRYAHSEELISIEKLQVDIGVLPDKNWEQTFAKVLLENIESALREQLNNSSNPSEVARQPLHTGLFQQWLHFLELGYLPWNASAGNSDEALQKNVLDTLASDAAAPEQLRRLLSKNDFAFNRLVLQHPEAFLKTLTAVFTARQQDALLDFRQEWKNNLREARKNKGQFPLIITEWLNRQAPESPAFFWKNILEIVVIEGRQLPAPALIGLFLERLAPANQLPVVLDFIEQALLKLQASGQPMEAVKNALATFTKKAQQPKEAFLAKAKPAPGDETAEAIAPRLAEAVHLQPADNQAVLGTAEPPAEAFLAKAEPALGDETTEAIAPRLSEAAQLQPADKQAVLGTAEPPVETFCSKSQTCFGR